MACRGRLSISDDLYDSSRMDPAAVAVMTLDDVNDRWRTHHHSPSPKIEDHARNSRLLSKAPFVATGSATYGPVSTIDDGAVTTAGWKAEVAPSSQSVAEAGFD